MQAHGKIDYITIKDIIRRFVFAPTVPAWRPRCDRMEIRG